MSILREDYGRLGKLRRYEWKNLLDSNKGLFKRIKSAPGHIIGPSLDDSGKVVGDRMSMENVFFGEIASKRQSEFFDELERVNPPAAMEYMLTITGSIERWEEDVRWLKVAVHYLEKEEDILSDEERLVEEGEKMNASLHIPPVLTRHFPRLFTNIDFENLSFEELLNEIRSVKTKLESEEHYLKDYLKKIKHEMPFLFE